MNDTTKTEAKTDTPESLFDKPENVDVIIDGAKAIAEMYKDSNIYALGRSPLWMVDTARKIDNSGNDYEYLAFSGRMYKADDHGRPKVYKADPYTKPSDEQLLAFRNYLDQIGLTPERLIEGNVVIVERTHSGESLYSFLQMLKKVGDYPIENLTLHIIKSPRMPDLPAGQFYPANITYQDFDHEVGRDLANSADSENPGVHYAYWEWGVVDPPHIGEYGTDRLQEISSLIDSRIERK